MNFGFTLEVIFKVVDSANTGEININITNKVAIKLVLFKPHHPKVNSGGGDI